MNSTHFTLMLTFINTIVVIYMLCKCDMFKKRERFQPSDTAGFSNVSVVQLDPASGNTNVFGLSGIAAAIEKAYTDAVAAAVADAKAKYQPIGAYLTSGQRVYLHGAGLEAGGCGACNWKQQGVNAHTAGPNYLVNACAVDAQGKPKPDPIYPTLRASAPNPKSCHKDDQWVISAA